MLKHKYVNYWCWSINVSVRKWRMIISIWETQTCLAPFIWFRSKTKWFLVNFSSVIDNTLKIQLILLTLDYFSSNINWIHFKITEGWFLHVPSRFNMSFPNKRKVVSTESNRTFDVLVYQSTGKSKKKSEIVTFSFRHLSWRPELISRFAMARWILFILDGIYNKFREKLRESGDQNDLRKLFDEIYIVRSRV